MRESEVRKHWEANAEAWTYLSRRGYDVTRDFLNTPAFLKLLGRVRGLQGLDLGCGEGHNTRLVARRGARMTAIDISGTFIRHALEEEARRPLGIKFGRASAARLPLKDRSFDFCMATMSFMDMANPGRALHEAFRVLKPGGFLQFSICHPCFLTPKLRWLYDAKGRKEAMAVGNYFRKEDGEIDEWIFGAAPAKLKRRFPKFRIPRFDRTLSSWVNLLLDTGFVLERLVEPYPSDATLRKYPPLYDGRIIAWSLIVRGRKPR
jgi:ubiquinone/menaquinone biosynthesis C-methylase UbiE